MLYSLIYGYKLWIFAIGLSVFTGVYARKVYKEYSYKKDVIYSTKLEKCLEKAEGDIVKVKECIDSP